MEDNNDAYRRMREELGRYVQQAVLTSAGAPQIVEDTIFSMFIEITPPEDPEISLGLVKIGKNGFGTASSRKPGNICLNWGKLMDVVPDVTIAAYGGVASPFWLLPFIGLYVCNKLWCGSLEELTEVEATVIYALWKNKTGEKKIDVDNGFQNANEIRRMTKLPCLQRKEFDRAIQRLLELKCITLKKGVIGLRERVHKEY